MNIALFGGSFDPPHVAHVLAALYALSAGGFDRVLVIPVFAHAFDKQLVAFEHRVAMTRLAMAPLPGAEVSTVEASLGAPSRTLRTLEHLRGTHPKDAFRLLLGADTFGQRAEWAGFDRIAQLAPPFVLGRQGVASDEAPAPVLPEVSSTRVRALLRETPGAREADPELVRLVPRSVLRYVDEHGLYR